MTCCCVFSQIVNIHQDLFSWAGTVISQTGLDLIDELASRVNAYSIISTIHISLVLIISIGKQIFGNCGSLTFEFYYYDH